MTGPLQENWRESGGEPNLNQYSGALNVMKRWELYDKLTDPHMDIVGEALLNLRLPSRGRVVDLACGDGNALLRLRKAYPSAELDGVDTNDVSISTETELERRGLKPVRFIHEKVEDLLPAVKDRHFDAVLCFFGMYEFDNPEDVLRQMCRITKPGGKIVIATMSPDNKPRHREFERMISEKLGAQKPPVNHASFNSVYADRLLPLYIDIEERIEQRSKIRVRTEDDIRIYLDSVDSMRERFSPYPFPGNSTAWYSLLNDVVAGVIRREISERGEFTDFAARNCYIGSPISSYQGIQ